MARFTVIIPLLGNNSSFEETLASALRYRPDSTQVIVVHDGSYNDPYGLGKEVDFVESVHRRSASTLIEMFNEGITVARGSIVAFLRPSVQLTNDWDQAVEQAFADPVVACVAPAMVSSQQGGDRLVTAGVDYGANFARQLVGTHQRLAGSHRQLFPLGPTSWGGFYRRSFLTALGSCDEQLDSNYLDLDLALGFQSLQFRCEYQPDCVLTIESEDAILNESRESHGCSAQRAYARFGDLVEQPAEAGWVSRIGGLIAGLFRSGTANRLQGRSDAKKFVDQDRQHHDLLEVLIKQRSYLLSPGLHSRVALQRHSSVSNTRRRAA